MKIGADYGDEDSGHYPSNKDYFLKGGILRDPGFWIIVVIVALLALVPLSGSAPDYYPPS